MRRNIWELLRTAGGILAAWLAFKYLLPLILPFLLGLALALGAEPMSRFFRRRLGIPRRIASGISVSMAFCLLALAVLLTAAFFLRELGMLADVLPDLEQTARSGITMLRSWTLALAEHTPSGVRPLVRENLDSLFSDGAAMLDKFTGFALTFAGNLLSHIPDSALGLGTALISAFLISAKLPRIRLWLEKRFPKEKWKPLLEALKRIREFISEI